MTLATYPAYPAASVEMRTKPEDGKEPSAERTGGGLVIRDRLRVRGAARRRPNDAATSSGASSRRSAASARARLDRSA